VEATDIQPEDLIAVQRAARLGRTLMKAALLPLLNSRTNRTWGVTASALVAGPEESAGGRSIQAEEFQSIFSRDPPPTMCCLHLSYELFRHIGGEFI